MSYISSPNMALPIPGVGTEPGAQYALDVNNSLTIIDGHTHNLGSGVQITPSAININAPLNMQNETLLNTADLNFTAQSLDASLSATAYVKGVDLYFKDGNGNIIQLTSGGSVNATASGITSGTATASFVSGVLVVNSNTNTPASIQGGSILIGNSGVLGSNYVTVQAPSALGASYALTLPQIPAQTNVVTIDTSGNMSSTTWNQVGVNMSATGANAIAASRTRNIANIVGIGGVAFTVSSGTFSTTSTSPTAITGLSATITTSGRPLQILIEPDANGSANAAYFNNSQSVGFLSINVGGTEVARALLGPNALASFSTVALNVSGFAGTYAVTAYAWTANASYPTSINYSKLVVYEL